MLAGPAGFEPANAGVKVLCLTAWRRPYLSTRLSHVLLIYLLIYVPNLLAGMTGFEPAAYNLKVIICCVSLYFFFHLTYILYHKFL